nr:MAG TPA: hypothetical protein [Microviridae sp.]
MIACPYNFSVSLRNCIDFLCCTACAPHCPLRVLLMRVLVELNDFEEDEEMEYGCDSE